MPTINPGNIVGPLGATQNFALQDAAGTIISKAGTITGSDGLGSSLFLQRILLPMVMNLSQIDMALSIGFPATNQGAGTMSRSVILYSFGNSTSLASVASASGSSSWNTGTSTVGASGSLTQFQGGWSSPLIQPMTFNSTSLRGGEYVIGQIFNFAQASSTWTLNLYGANGVSNVVASAATNLTSATLAAVSTGGLIAASAFTATSSSSLTAWSAAPTVVNAMSSSGLIAGSGITGISSYASQYCVMSMTSPLVAWTISQSMTVASLSTISSAMSGANWSISSSATAKTDNVALVWQSSNSNILSSVGTVAGSIHSASGSGIALSNAGTSAFAGFMGSGGLLAGSFRTASASFGAVTNVALGALSSTTLAQIALPNFGYIGTGSTTTNFPSVFMSGIMSTGAVPVSINLTSTAVTYFGSLAYMQPWFRLVGAV